MAPVKGDRGGNAGKRGTTRPASRSRGPARSGQVARDPVVRDPVLWRRRFVLDPMRRVLAGANSEILGAVSAAGYPDVTVQHLSVFALVPRHEGMRMSELAERLQITPGAATQMVEQLER